MKLKLLAAAGITALAVSATSANATPLYNPVGPQTNVSLATVTGGGWTQCYAATMSVFIGNAAQNVLNGCSGTYLMMAGRQTGSNTFLVLAQTLLSDTIIDTGQTSTTHSSNGSEWWFSNNWSWGFTAAGDTVSNNECDISSSPTSMCLHTVNGAGGYRINDITGLNASTAYEKVFFVANDMAIPEPGTLALFGLGLAGLGFARRRKATV